MGKRTRRQRHKRRDQKQCDRPSNDDDYTKGPTILQRLRHADPKTRHAALAALLHTSLHPDRLLLRPVVDVNLLQAIREQVSKPDLLCATAAAGCLANYAAFSRSSEQDALTAGWMVVLTKRLRDAAVAVISPTVAEKQQWLEFTEQCLTCLVHLVENNPMAVDRLLPGMRTHDDELRNELLSVITELLRLTIERSKNTVASMNNDDDGDMARVVSIQTLCCRCLHSLWDDNPDLLLPWLEQQESTARQTLELLLTLLHAKSPSIARLHSVGAWVAAWTLLRTTSSSYNNLKTNLQTAVPRCMEVLRESLCWDREDRAPQIKMLCAAHAAHMAQQADHELERQVVSAQEQKKEPARLIARRLKEEQPQKQSQPHLDVKMASMQEEENVVDWESSCSQWQESIRSLQLALEITANLTSVSTPLMRDAVDDDDEMMLESEDIVTLDSELLQPLIQHRIPYQVVQLSNQLSTKRHESWPKVVQESISDLQCKTAVCLGHCLANLTGWTPPSSLWQDLQHTWRVAADASAQESVGSTMVVALRSSQSVRTTQIQSSNLDFLLQMLEHSSSIVVRDAVCMLGILCSEESHPVEVNEKVVDALIKTSTGDTDSDKSTVGAMVLSEVLSVLMDIYGDDDCHTRLFESRNVLNHFQRSLPALKQRISLEGRSSGPEDVEQWKETAMNAARFIQYKKGHLR